MFKVINMENIFAWFNSFVDGLIANLGLGSALISCFCITIESMVPILPLFAFITINFLVFGSFFGFIISYIFTIIGCSISFFLFRKLQLSYFKRKKKEAGKIIKTLNKIKLTHLVIILSNPFTPAFAVNIGAGISKMTYKKFFNFAFDVMTVDYDKMEKDMQPLKKLIRSSSLILAKTVGLAIL